MNLPSVAVVVVCHKPYEIYLSACLRSIDSQSVRPTKKILVCDGFTPQVPFGWTVLRGDWGNPCGARNAALSFINETWTVFYDADNVMHPNYLGSLLLEAAKADDKVGVIYPNIVRLQNNQITWSRKAPRYSYWLLRRKNYIDTSSIWRTEAVKSVGWHIGQARFDDYALALRITKLGWEGKAAENVFTQLTQHGKNRSNDFSVEREALWQCNDLTIILLYSGKPQTAEVFEWLVKEPLPPSTSFIFVNDSPSFPLNSIQPLFSSHSVTILQAPPNLHSNDPNLTPWEAKHYRVAELYNLAISSVRSAITVTLEDDVLPQPGDLKRLVFNILSMSNIKVAVSALYPSRADSARACVSFNKTKWTDVPLIQDVPPRLLEVGMIPGGFSAYQTWALQACLPLSISRSPAIGWDGVLSKRFKSLGYPVFLDGSIKCKHYT